MCLCFIFAANRIELFTQRLIHFPLLPVLIFPSLPLLVLLCLFSHVYLIARVYLLLSFVYDELLLDFDFAWSLLVCLSESWMISVTDHFVPYTDIAYALLHYLPDLWPCLFAGLKHSFYRPLMLSHCFPCFWVWTQTLSTSGCMNHSPQKRGKKTLLIKMANPWGHEIQPKCRMFEPLSDLDTKIGEQ